MEKTLHLEFWNFLSGVPNSNLHFSRIREKVVQELENNKTILKFDNDQQKLNFTTYVTYINVNYLALNAKFPFSNWKQFTNITTQCSRTTDVSECIHSSCNRNFPRRYNFNTSLEKLFEFKKTYIMSLAALEPKHYFNQIPIKPSKKRAVRTSDLVRLTALSDKVLLFNNLTPNNKIWDSNLADCTFE